MFDQLVLTLFYLTIIFINPSSFIFAVIFSDTYDYDAYGTRLASNDHFVVLAQNDGGRYVVSMAPFGADYMCTYNYSTSNDFLISIATGRQQNSSQLSFVYLLTNSTDGSYQKLGLFTFSRDQIGGSTNGSCSSMLGPNDGQHEVIVWKQEPSEISTLQVDLYGKYAYGFLSSTIFIYNIENSSVHTLLLSDIFQSIQFIPHALDVSETDDGVAIAVVAGYYLFDVVKALPIVYLIQLNPPYSMTILSNYTMISYTQKFVQVNYASTYQFDYVMSVSIHDSTQQVLVAVPQVNQVCLFSFNSTTLTFIYQYDYPSRSVVWLDDSGKQGGFLLNGITTLPWAQSRIDIVNITSDEILYVYPNNQQKLKKWLSTAPAFIRLTTTYDYQLIVLTSDGTIVLVPSIDAGYYSETDNINNDRTDPIACPPGTYKNTRGTMHCTICPTMTRSFSTFDSLNGANLQNPIINCSACSTGSFCPLASIKNVNSSLIQSRSQAYAYPTSSASASIDDILMQNVFSLQSQPRRCLFISPFFWALITLTVAITILFIMGILQRSPKVAKNFRRVKYIFRHSDLITNGEFWFGGVVSLSVIVLIIYTFWFGAVFTNKYPIETSSRAYFLCDETQRNTQFSSALQLLATIKTDAEKPIFNLLDNQQFTMTVHFLQTGFNCNNIATQENIGSYSVTLPISNCTDDVENARIIVFYRIPSHQMTIRINLTGLYFIGGMLICLTGPSSTLNDSSTYVVQELNYCESFYTSNQTLGQTTTISLTLTKVINQTEYLDYSGSVDYSGIWIPTSTHGSLDDHIAYQQQGEYQRYLSTQSIVIISFDETGFYVINQQAPIVRICEVIFHIVIFTTTIIGIFTLVFLVFKLISMPCLKFVIKRKEIFFELYR